MWQHACLSTSIAFYDVHAYACTEIKIFETYIFKIFGFVLIFLCLYIIFLSRFCSYWSSTGVASSSKNSEKLSFRQAIFTVEQPLVVAGNFALSFSLKFLSIFVHISGSAEPITLIWVLLERSFPPVSVEYEWYQFQSKVRTSEVEQRPRHVTAVYGWYWSQWVNFIW